MENISVEIRSVGGAQIITLEGRLDAAVALEVREQLKGLIDGGDVHLVFDLEGVGFVDSTGLSVLITALKTASARGGDVVLAEQRGRSFGRRGSPPRVRSKADGSSEGRWDATLMDRPVGQGEVPCRTSLSCSLTLPDSSQSQFRYFRIPRGTACPIPPSDPLIVIVSVSLRTSSQSRRRLADCMCEMVWVRIRRMLPRGQSVRYWVRWRGDRLGSIVRILLSHR